MFDFINILFRAGEKRRVGERERKGESSDERSLKEIRIELLVPRLEDRGGHVKSTPVQT